MAKIGSTGKLIDVLREIHVNRAYNQVKSLLPRWLNSTIRSAMDKYSYMPLVAPDEIRPKYKLACEVLIEKLVLVNSRLAGISTTKPPQNSAI